MNYLKICEEELEDSFAIKIFHFMFLLNKASEPDLGIWSMRNIRKIYRRIKLQKLKIESKEYKNITYNHQIVFYILQSINPNRRNEILEVIIELMRKSFNISNREEEEIKYCIKSDARLEIIDNSLYLMKGDSGIRISKEIENNLRDFDELNSFLESLFYCLFCHINEPILLLGPSGYKAFLSKFLLPNNSAFINLYNETSLTQLLGSITLTNTLNAKYFYLNKILEICHKKNCIKELSEYIKYIPIKITNEEEIKKEMEEEIKRIREYEDKVLENDNSDSDDENVKKRKRIIRKRGRKKLDENLEKIKNKNEEKEKSLKLLEFENKIQDIIESTKNQLEYSISIHKVLDNLKKKLFEKIIKNSDNLFGDFTAIFKEGIIPYKILLQ